MNRSELLEVAEKKLGRPVRPYHLDYAIRRGYVSPAARRPDGWNAYGEKSVNDLVRYMRERSRTSLPASA